MKTPLYLPIVILLACAVLPFESVRANLITNGGFETGDLSGWAVTHAPTNGNIFVANGLGPDTSLGVFFGAGSTGFDTIRQSFATTPDTFYTLSFFYQLVDTGGKPNNELRVLFGGNLVYDDVNAIPGFGPFSFNVQATGSSTTLEFDARNVPSFDFVDNVAVTAVSAPENGSTLVILACALIALLATRRRLSIA